MNVAIYSPAIQQQPLQGLDGVNVQNASANIAQASGAIAGVAALVAAGTGPGAAIAAPIAAVAGAVAGVAALVSRIAKDNDRIALEAASGKVEQANAQLRLQILQLDQENNKLQNVIAKANGDLRQFSGLGFCLINCGYKEAEASLKTANQQYTDLKKELEDKSELSAQLANRALETVKKLAGMKTEKNLLLIGAGGVLALSVGYLIYKLF